MPICIISIENGTISGSTHSLATLLLLLIPSSPVAISNKGETEWTQPEFPPADLFFSYRSGYRWHSARPSPPPPLSEP
ncbi:hypothetical protein SBA4_2610011 [Candidatus Sulfopaludibacter sp. SbA4]|nr:hypothetical protein SBA4_2610011 [Candidatus Sulfopaludibacter sp. SbA4]